MVSFWKYIQKENNARVPLATTIGGVTGDTDIAEMWQDHYKSILNSVKGNSHQHFVTTRSEMSRNFFPLLSPEHVTSDTCYLI